MACDQVASVEIWPCTVSGAVNGHAGSVCVALRLLCVKYRYPLSAGGKATTSDPQEFLGMPGPVQKPQTILWFAMATYMHAQE